MNNIKKICNRHLNDLINKMSDLYEDDHNFSNNLCVYACGSLGRLEMKEPSDLDLFFISMNNSSEKNFSNIDKYCFFSKLYDINKELNYKDPSKGGQYWDFISEKDLLDIGSRKEDYNNSFTARMLLILESKSIYNKVAYETLINKSVNKYFIDYKRHKDNFHPLYLMNDILRYWYTLTMNYEYRRDERDNESQKNWKRLKLKYARLITCFSMLACLYKKNITPNYVKQCIALTPFERLDSVSSWDNKIESNVKKIAEEYEWFLSLKSESHEWWNIAKNKKKALQSARRFHELVVHGLMTSVAKINPELRDMTDAY